MPTIDDPATRLDRLLDQQEVRIARVFRTAIASLKDEIDLNELADLIQQGRTDEALDRLRHAAEAIGAASNVAFVTTGQSTADFLTRAGVGRIVFDQVNMFAVAAMQRNTLDLITEFTSEQRRAASSAIIAGIESGINPIAQARNFRDSVGLTQQQWGHVASYRAVLERVGTDATRTEATVARALRDGRGDAQIKRLIREGRPLPPEKIDWLVQRYADRYVKHRAEVIGRSEALRAVNQGNEEMYRQAIADGTIDADRLTRKWVTRLDGRERETHRLLNNVPKAWGEPWVTRNGEIKYPGDPDAPAVETIMCRCTLTTRLRTLR